MIYEIAHAQSSARHYLFFVKQNFKSNQGRVVWESIVL